MERFDPEPDVDGRLKLDPEPEKDDRLVFELELDDRLELLVPENDERELELE